MTGWIAVVSTAYCLSGTMADGTGVRAGSVANNSLPLGTKITVTASPTGARQFVVRDRIGWGTQLDFWVPSCAQAIAWGRRTVRLRVGWQFWHRWRGEPRERSVPRLRLLADPDSAGRHCDLDPGRHQLRLTCRCSNCWRWPGWLRFASC